MYAEVATPEWEDIISYYFTHFNDVVEVYDKIISY